MILKYDFCSFSAAMYRMVYFQTISSRKQTTITETRSPKWKYTIHSITNLFGNIILWWSRVREHTQTCLFRHIMVNDHLLHNSRSMLSLLITCFCVPQTKLNFKKQWTILSNAYFYETAKFTDALVTAQFIIFHVSVW